MDEAKRDALVRAKARLDPLRLYPRPVSLRGVRIWIVPSLFRLPWFGRFDGYAAHWTIVLRARAFLDDDALIAHELCHVWQMQHRPVAMPLSYLWRGYERNPYELRRTTAGGAGPTSVAEQLRKARVTLDDQARWLDRAG